MPVAEVLSRDLDEIAAAPLDWGRLRGKRVLVSGAAGMLGGVLAQSVLRLNQGVLKGAPAKVLALVRDRAKAEAAFGPWLKDPNLELLIQDVVNGIDPEGPVDFILHAASLASPRDYMRDLAGTLAANSVGTRRLLELAKARRSEAFLYLSSSEVYGQAPVQPIPEDGGGYQDPMQLRHAYAQAKRAGEAYCAAYWAQHQVPAVVARPFHTYGAALRLDDGRIYADVAADVLAGRDLILKSDGSARRAFCYITDATVAFYLLLFKGQPGEAYNVGNPEQELSMLELAQAVAALRPAKGLKVQAQPAARDAFASKVSRNLPDVAKLLALGWRPKVSVSEGFARVLEHHEAL